MKIDDILVLAAVAVGGYIVYQNFFQGGASDSEGFEPNETDTNDVELSGAFQ